MPLLRYIASLPTSRLVLWSYVIWWVVMVSYHFSLNPRMWATSLGIGIVVGFALMLSTGPVSLDRLRNRFWESIRLFVCPYMVSSFAALVAGNDFVLVFSPILQENATAAASILAFLMLAQILKITMLRGEQ